MGVRLNRLATHAARTGRSLVHVFASGGAVLAHGAGHAARFLTREPVLVALAFFGGLALASAGIALIYLPAGLIFSGLVLASCAGMYARSIARRPV